jgi:hypothetical protein
VTAVNDAPVIVAQNNVSTRERTAVELQLADLVIDDPDNDPSEFSLSVIDGPDYQRQGNTITPLPGVVGNIQVSLSVSDAEATSEVYSLTLLVLANPPPPPPVQKSGGGSIGYPLLALLLSMLFARRRVWPLI